VFLRNEELRAQVIFYHNIRIKDSQRSYTSENKIFCDFVGKGTHIDDEDVCIAHPGGIISLDASGAGFMM
jgi:hypothetical protein